MADTRKLHRLVTAFEALTAQSPRVTATAAGAFEVAGVRYVIPRYVFRGPATNVPPKRVGLFGLVHGDEPAGALALLDLLQTLVAEPQRAAGYDLVLYPICNPTGYKDGTRHNLAGLDLNRQFWSDSPLPEVRILETELRTQAFDGLIALHADDTSSGLYGYAHGRELNEGLLVPALRASERVIPCNHDPMIDGFAACAGVINDCFKGVLRPHPDQRPQPFEIIFETPGQASEELQAQAAEIAVLSILTEYRRFMSYAQGI
jgi:predicted deacylase